MDRPDALARLSDHLIVCNVNEKVGTLVQEVRASAAPGAVVLIVQDASLWQAHPEWHPPHDAGELFTVEGSPSDPAVLERAGVARARAAVILADPRRGELADAHTALIALAIEAHNPRVHTLVDLVRSQNADLLTHTVVDDVVCAAAVTERLLVQSLVTPWLKNVFKNLCSTRPGSGKLFLLAPPPALCGESFRELTRRTLAGDHPWVLCGVVRKEAATLDDVLCPLELDRPLDRDDRLVVVSSAGAPTLELLVGATP